jgi:hypothetical protein
MKESIELWKLIADSNYMISNLGRVQNRDTGYIRNCSKNDKGYLHFTVNYLGTQRTLKVHRLVAKSFIDNPFNLPEVNHSDCNKENNTVSNLEWISSRDNISHAVLNNRFTVGSAHPKSKLNEKDVIEIRSMLSTGISCSEISKHFNVHWKSIKDIETGKNWKHLK